MALYGFDFPCRSGGPKDVIKIALKRHYLSERISTHSLLLVLHIYYRHFFVIYFPLSVVIYLSISLRLFHIKH